MTQSSSSATSAASSGGRSPPPPTRTAKSKRSRNASRVGMACKPCRQSKLKCDGAKPRCQRCLKRSQSCYWAELDGRSTEAKRTRRASEAGHESSAETSIAQLELLANAAVDGASSTSSTTSFPLTAPQPFLAHVAPPSPPPLRLGHDAIQQPFLAGAVTTPPLFTPNSDLNAFGAPHLWWERYGAANARRFTPTNGATAATAVDPSMVDTWSSLGLEPQLMTGDMMDMLTGKVVWVDQPGQSQPAAVVAAAASNAAASSSAEQIASDETAWQGRLANSGDQPASPPKPAAEVVRLQYFRLLGPTGISPGIKKISMELKLTPSIRRALFDSDSTRQGGAQRVDWERLMADVGGETGSATGWDTAAGVTAVQSGSEEDVTQPSTASGRPDLFDGDTPARWVLDELLPIFFDRLGDHYLCLNRRGLEARLGLRQNSSSPPNSFTRSVQPMLINAMCALAARFSTHPDIVAGRSSQRAHSFGKRFARKAKDFLVTSLTVPSRSTTLAFLMIAWHEFACNLDSAFWNYGGMALRMATDLGLQRDSFATRAARDVNESDLIDDALLFWAVYQMDRILVVGTGRPTSIKDREITTPYPSIEDMPTNGNIIFGYYIRHVRIGGRIAEAINSTLSPEDELSEESARELDGLEAELIKSYESIPSRLRLNTANFKATTQKHLFLEFHLWFHNLLFILNRSPIVEMRKSVNRSDAVKMVRKSVQRCADVVALDDAYDNRILESVPMANQTLFLAGCAELEESRQSISSHPSPSNGGGQLVSSRHLMLEAEEGYGKFASALERISIFWDGVRWICGVLTQRKMGRSHTDLVELAVGTDALVSKREMRLLQRLSSTAGGGGADAAVLANDSGHSSASSHNAHSPPSRPPVEISDVASLDELASFLPQFQAVLAQQAQAAAPPPY